MEARMTNPALTVPDAMTALQALGKAVNMSAKASGLAPLTLHLAYLRASQIRRANPTLAEEIRVELGRR